VVRPKHTSKELEAILREMEDRQWLITRGKGYYVGKCPCKEHIKTVRLTPSNPMYGRNLRSWLRKLECWKEAP